MSKKQCPDCKFFWEFRGWNHWAFIDPVEDYIIMECPDCRKKRWRDAA